jgi:hypothetical protein
MRTRIPVAKIETPSHVRRRRRSRRDDEFIIRHPIQPETNRSRSREELTKHEQDRLILPRTVSLAGESVQRLQQQVGNNATQQVIANAEAGQKQGGGGGDSLQAIQDRLADVLDHSFTDWHKASNTALDEFIYKHWDKIQNNPPGYASQLTSSLFKILPMFWGGRAADVITEIITSIVKKVSEDNQQKLISSQTNQQHIRFEQFRDLMRERFEKIVEELKDKKKEIVLALWPEIELEYWKDTDVALSPDALESVFLKKVFDEEYINGSSINVSRIYERIIQELEKEWKKQSSTSHPSSSETQQAATSNQT